MIERGSRRALPGVAVAGLTACISGLSVFVNSYGVHAISPASAYTTAKNVVAAVLLAVGTVVARALARRRARGGRGRALTPGATGGAVARWAEGAGRRSTQRPAAGSAWARATRWVGLAYVGVVGGGLAFVLFFDGLAHSAAAPAAFWHDTLVVWVAVLAVPLLGERLRWWNGLAIAVLVVGQVVMAGGAGHLSPQRGEMLVLAATVLWAVEAVVAKVLLRELAPATVALTRMTVGAATLLVYLGATGSLHVLRSLDLHQLGWVLVTGTLLAGYVATWTSALARSWAVDVTSVLVAGALITSLLDALAGAAAPAPHVLGVVMVAAATGAVLWAASRRDTSPQSEAIEP
jgi:drug/metabolite transporter (DMT)-like permease